MAKGIAALVYTSDGSRDPQLVTYSASDTLVDAAWAGVAGSDKQLTIGNSTFSVLYAILYSTATLNGAGEVIGGTISATTGQMIGANPPHPNSLTTLTTGNAANNIPVNSSTIVIAGPSGAFTYTGFAMGRHGQKLRIINLVAQDMTISNASSSSAVGNRVASITGSDIVTTGKGIVDLVYDAVAGVWYGWLVAA
jgi:hypothetical protein